MRDAVQAFEPQLSIFYVMVLVRSFFFFRENSELVTSLAYIFTIGKALVKIIFDG